MGENYLFENEKIDRKEFSSELAKKLESLCDKQNLEISNAQFDGYHTLFQQKLAWYREFEQKLKRIKNRKNKD